MDKILYDSYIKILEEELVPAMGCTEPISVAYAAALARETLGQLPERVQISVSGNILKNVKSVIVPGTGGLKGINAAAAAGIIAGNAGAKLQVLASLTPSDIEKISQYTKTAVFKLAEARTDCVFDIHVRVFSGEDSAYVHIENYHTNVVRVEKNGRKLTTKKAKEHTENNQTDRTLLNVFSIVEFINSVDTTDISDVISRQIRYNCAIADEGLRGDYGARIGKIILAAYGNDVHNRAKAYAAAGSDARMSGCTLPVVIVSGSGNQGMTASLPVVVYARELNANEDKTIRAVALSDLITVHLKSGIGRLSAYCGAVSAGAGAAAGICYLYGGGYDEISHTVVNALAIDSGLICDGAKSSCAAKIAAAVDAGLFGFNMYKNGSEFYGGDGILTCGVEETIDNVCDLARIGMKGTDEEIIKLMLGTKAK